MAYVGISRRAVYDIDQIDAYSRNKWGQKVADDYLTSIDLAIQHVANNPALLRSKPEVSRVFYLYRVREHYLVCCTIDDNIYILTVAHGSVDLPVRLAELAPSLLEEAQFLHSRFNNT